MYVGCTSRSSTGAIAIIDYAGKKSASPDALQPTVVTRGGSDAAQRHVEALKKNAIGEKLSDEKEISTSPGVLQAMIDDIGRVEAPLSPESRLQIDCG